MASYNEVINYLYRCKCKNCQAILWIDSPTGVVCICGGCSINSNGEFFGDYELTSDEEMIEYISIDWKLKNFSISKIDIE